MKKDKRPFYLWIVLLIIIVAAFIVGNGNSKSGNVSGVFGINYPYVKYHCVDDGTSDHPTIKNSVTVYTCKENYNDISSLKKSYDEEDCLLYELSNECIDEKMLKRVFCGGADLGENIKDTVADNIINCGKVGMICEDGACRKQ